MAVPILETWAAANSAGVTVNTLDVNKPSGVVSGDLLLIIAENDHNSGSTIFDEITGFTKIIEHGDTNSDCLIATYWRVADGTEGSNFTVTTVGLYELLAWCLRISGADETTPIDAFTGYSSPSNSTEITPTSWSSTVADTLIIQVAAFDGADGDPFTITAGSGTIVDHEASGTTGIEISGCFAQHDLASSGPVGVATFDAVGGISDGWGYVGMAIAPAAASTSILNQIQGTNLGSDLFNGTIL